MKTHPLVKLFRDNTAKAIKDIREDLIMQTTPAYSEEHLHSALWVIVSIIGCALLILIASCIPAHAYSDEQIVNAIYKAEGGKHATYPYGIRSVKCVTQEACRKICTNTVRNNRTRFKKDGLRISGNFIEFIGSRYCPIKGSSLSKREKLVNKYWISNVTYFLKKG